MGSFAASVDLAERLRPWAQSGLAHVFLPDGLQQHVPDALGRAVCADPVSALEDSPAPGPHPTAAEATPSAEPEWPAPWSQLATRVRTAPRVIITYSSLADDVAIAADPSRRKLFQTILAFLGWPQGTTLFWPISFPTNADPGIQFASDVFAAGVRHYDVQHVLCFGPAPAHRARTLFPPEDKSVHVHELPTPEQLLALLPHELHQTLSAVKALRIV